MNPHLAAVPPILPVMPLHHHHHGRRSNEHFTPPPLPLQAPPHVPISGYHHGQPHPQQYPPREYRAYQAYPIHPVPPPQYPPAPLVVSSYPPPHAHGPPPPPLPPTFYHATPPPAPSPRPSSSSVQSQALVSPTSSNTSLNVSTPVLTPSTQSLRNVTPPSAVRPVFSPPLPWYSVPDEPFPPRARRGRRKRRAPQTATSPLQLPDVPRVQRDSGETMDSTPVASASLAPSEAETPSTSQPPSEADSTHPTTPSSSLPLLPPSIASQSASSKTSSRKILPALPLAPAIPFPPEAARGISRDRSSTVNSSTTKSGAVEVAARLAHEGSSDPKDSAPDEPAVQPSPNERSADTPQPAPKSWADLVRSSAPRRSAPEHIPAGNGTSHANGVMNGSTGSLAEVLASFDAGPGEYQDRRTSFLEPRGLVNTGNMCYMNSILQILVFCVPFYIFLDQVGKRSTHSFKDDTPLLDAMLAFMREFGVIDSATSAEQLRLRLKQEELEQYREAFIPDFVYEVIRRLPRFSSMRRGHQQDAEEFLGFLLEGLHDECVQVMRGAGPLKAKPASQHPTEPQIPSPRGSVRDSSASPAEDTNVGWLEVGPKQKAAVTRSSGTITTQSPITKIFGGYLRSELRVPGLKNSVTLEPYQPLQLDIQSPQVNDIIDALKGLTRPEALHGNFNSPRGPNATATKQVFIESLPPVLILHLKRFHYDNKGGTQKLWKKISYPLDLELPKEIFPAHKRGGRLPQGGKYQLIGVVYHHGSNASVGHYTVDVRRQDGREWVRLDDTVIRRIRSEDVAEGGGEEDSKTLKAVLEQHKNDASSSGNIFDQIGLDHGGTDGMDKGWNQVNGGVSGNMGSAKTGDSGNANGTQTPQQGPARTGEKHSLRDNKVAYLLFYQRV